MNNKKVEVYVVFIGNKNDNQKKVFKDYMTYVKWCRMNSEKIYSINSYVTNGKLMRPYDLIRYVDKGDFN